MTDKSSSFSAIFGVSRESANLSGVAVAAVRSGFAVLPVYPGEKRPMCTLTPAKRKSADKAAQKEAKERGQRNWNTARHRCGVHEAITKDTTAKSVFDRLLPEYPGLNLAIEVGRSHVLVVDADTAEEVEGFTNYWAEQSGVDAVRNVKPTIVSPGKVNKDGEQVHYDGGHFYFRLPEDVDFSNSPAARGLKLPGGAMAYVKDRVILVPPSVREEGPYTLESDIFGEQSFLTEAVQQTIVDFNVRKAQQTDKVWDEDDPITIWSLATPWDDLLSAAGWTLTQRSESCGCPAWLRPDDPASDKSAVAHEEGCTTFGELRGGFLHLWSDNAFPGYENGNGNRNMTKLNFVAHTWHDGNVSDAMSALQMPSQETIESLIGEVTDTLDREERRGRRAERDRRETVKLFEEDEPVEQVEAAFEQGTKTLTEEPTTVDKFVAVYTLLTDLRPHLNSVQAEILRGLL